MAGRPRHRRPDLEALLRELEARGWRVVKGGGYFKAYCPCAEKHLKTIHLTPSGGDYTRNLRAWFNRLGCWEA